MCFIFCAFLLPCFCFPFSFNVRNADNCTDTLQYWKIRLFTSHTVQTTKIDNSEFQPCMSPQFWRHNISSRLDVRHCGLYILRLHFALAVQNVQTDCNTSMLDLFAWWIHFWFTHSSIQHLPTWNSNCSSCYGNCETRTGHLLSL